MRWILCVNFFSVNVYTSILQERIARDTCGSAYWNSLDSGVRWWLGLTSSFRRHTRKTDSKLECGTSQPNNVNHGLTLGSQYIGWWIIIHNNTFWWHNNTFFKLGCWNKCVDDTRKCLNMRNFPYGSVRQQNVWLESALFTARIGQEYTRKDHIPVWDSRAWVGWNDTEPIQNSPMECDSNQQLMKYGGNLSREMPGWYPSMVLIGTKTAAVS